MNELINITMLPCLTHLGNRKEIFFAPELNEASGCYKQRPPYGTPSLYGAKKYSGIRYMFVICKVDQLSIVATLSVLMTVPALEWSSVRKRERNGRTDADEGYWKAKGQTWNSSLYI